MTLTSETSLGGTLYQFRLPSCASDIRVGAENEAGALLMIMMRRKKRSLFVGWLLNVPATG